MTGDTVRSSLAEWSAVAVTLLFGTTMLAQAYVIPTGSMETTLMTGDMVLVDKLAYAPPGALGSKLLPYREVRRGDLIVFRYPPDISKTYVKRCVAVPGDRVSMRERRLYVNGAAVEEPYARHIDPRPDPARDNFPELRVREGHYFALGDNRDNSEDSRYWSLAPRAHIVGRPLLVYWSYQPREGREANVFDALGGLFTRTRWNRILSVPR